MCFDALQCLRRWERKVRAQFELIGGLRVNDAIFEPSLAWDINEFRAPCPRGRKRNTR